MTDTQHVHYLVRDAVGVISLSNPPVNALAPGMREAIVEALGRAAADPDVRAIVLIGHGGHFVAGADIRHLGAARGIGSRVSAAALEASPKPVVAAIDGFALGGGLEHALGCHARLATGEARLGLPEIKLGLIPGGGGTQRLTRLLGPELAAEIILSGRHVPADEALDIGLIDRIVPRVSLLENAITHARSLAESGTWTRLAAREDRLDAARHDAGWLERIRALGCNRARGQQAPLRAIDCIEAAVTGTFEAGMALEQTVFEALEQSDESRALRYAFFAERQSTRLPGPSSDAEPEPVNRAAVIGAGTMGSGIAICFADAGIPIKVLERDAEALARGMDRIRETYAARVRRGSLAQSEMDRRLALIEAVSRYDEIADCDAVIEAVFERVDIKQEVFRAIDTVAKPGALLLTNSSAIDIDVMARATRRPESVAGAHFFAPANVMKLCEVVQGPQTARETIVRTLRMGRDLGKICAVAGSCDGFAANRSRAPMMTELMLMIEEGARPQQIDQVMVDFGYPLGPFAVNDISGLDVSYEGRKRRAAADPSYRKLHVPDCLVEMGRKGQKTGAGWYRYEKGDRTPRHDPLVDEIITSVAIEFGIEQRSFSAEEILQRVLFASVNEACRILEEGKAYRASDIDVMWLHGFGFPRHRGGLLYWADGIGASAIHAQIAIWHERYGRRWHPSALLAETAARGGRLRELTATRVA